MRDSLNPGDDYAAQQWPLEIKFGRPIKNFTVLLKAHFAGACAISDNNSNGLDAGH